MTVYAALRNALLVVDGERVEERLTDHDLECVAVAGNEGSGDDAVLVGTYDAGLWRSADGGDTFERVGEGTLREHVMSLAVNPRDEREVWAGTEPSRVYRSTDAGRTWEERPGITDLESEPEWYFPPRPDTHHVRWLEVDPHDPAHVYVGIELGALVQTHDRGETWSERPPGSRRDNHSLATHPDDEGRVYAAAGDGYAESRDAGATWEHPQEGLEHRYCWSVRPDPGDPDTVVVSSATGARTAHNPDRAETYVYRREGDEPWRVSMDGLPDSDGLLRPVLATGGPGEFYALTNHGLYRSTDAGEWWSDVGLPWYDALTRQTPRGLVVTE